jgi:hypothetical protein
VVQKIPPPPPIANQDPTFNRWLLEFISILNNQGGIDQSSITGLPALSAQVTTNTGNIATNTAAIAAETARAEAAEALLAPLASPALTGIPTAPMAVAGTNTTQLATTAFVQARGGATHNGTGAPAAGLGAVGDWYGDVAGAVGARVWIKTAVGTWIAFPF